MEPILVRKKTRIIKRVGKKVKIEKLLQKKERGSSPVLTFRWPSIYVHFIFQNKGALPAGLIGTREYARIVRFVLV